MITGIILREKRACFVQLLTDGNRFLIEIDKFRSFRGPWNWRLMMSKRAMLIGWIRFFKITGRVADSNFFIIIYLQCPEISQRMFLLHQFQFHNRFRVRKKVTKTLFRSLYKFLLRLFITSSKFPRNIR